MIDIGNGRRPQLHPASFEFGKIEDLIDHAEKTFLIAQHHVERTANRLRHLTVPIGQDLLERAERERDGRAQLV